MSLRLPSDLRELYKKGKEDPAFFVENVVGMTTLWQKQKEIMYSIRDNKKTAVRSCNGAGKTFTTANAVAWFLSTHPGSICISTAPTARQVRELLWQEINNIHKGSKYPLGGTTTMTSWTLGPKWFALGLSTDDPNRFQGFHADNILGVIDEAAGVDADIWIAMDSILTSSGARLLVIGNPTEPSGNFYDAFSSPLFNKIHISAFDTPNFTEGKTVYPALITPEWANERKIEWGEDSPAYQARVLGNFPVIGTNTMIPLGYVLAAKERSLDFTPEDVCIMSVDVARFGDDESVIGIRRGNSYSRQSVFNSLDVYELSKKAEAIARSENPSLIKVDAVGIGAGVADNLRAWGLKAVDFIAQGRAWEPDKFVNRRTEAWYNVREKFRKNLINIPPDEHLLGQLTSPKYDFDAAGRYRLEGKDQMKNRGLKSPDRADALVMCFESDITDVGSYLPAETKDETKKGTVSELLRQLTHKEVEEHEWHMM